MAPPGRQRRPPGGGRQADAGGPRPVAPDPGSSGYRSAPTAMPPDAATTPRDARGCERTGSGAVAASSASILGLNGSSLPRPLRKEPVFRPRQPEIVTQGPALVFAAEQPAPLQFRHDPVDKIVEPARYPREHDVEPVAGVSEEPFLHLVGDGLRRADHCQPAIAAGDLGQLAHRQGVAPGAGDHPLAAAPSGGRLPGVLGGRRGRGASGWNCEASHRSAIDRLAIPLSGWTRLSSKARFARASSSVSPVTTRQPGRILMWSGLRPAALARLLMSA